MWGIGVSLAVAIGDGLTADSISFIRPAGKVFVAAALAAERPPARINRTDLTQDAQLGLAHPNNHNSQLPKPNYQPLPISPPSRLEIQARFGETSPELVTSTPTSGGGQLPTPKNFNSVGS